MIDRDPSADRAYLRLLASCLMWPGQQKRLDPSEIAQATLARAAAREGQFRGATPQEWRGWLRMILLNTLREAARPGPAEVSLDAASGQLESALAAEQTSPSEAAIRSEELERLARALDQMPADEREAVELKHLHDCSMRFIGELMGRTEQAVDGLLKRGRRRLLNLLGGQP